MSKFEMSDLLITSATATFTDSSSQIVPRDGNCIAAIAFTDPSRPRAVVCVGAHDNSEISKSLTCYIRKRRFFIETATTLRRASFQIRRMHNSRLSARASALPSRNAFSKVWGTFNDRESSERLVSQINESHDVTSWLKVVVEKMCWQAGNQYPLFRSDLSQQNLIANLQVDVNG